jgi:YD repeat-containing protein
MCQFAWHSTDISSASHDRITPPHYTTHRFDFFNETAAMKKPIWSWNNTLKTLGYKITRIFKPEPTPTASDFYRPSIESIEPRQMLAGDLFAVSFLEDSQTQIVDLREVFNHNNRVPWEYEIINEDIGNDDILSDVHLVDGDNSLILNFEPNNNGAQEIKVRASLDPENTLDGQYVEVNKTINVYVEPVDDPVTTEGIQTIRIGEDFNGTIGLSVEAVFDDIDSLISASNVSISLIDYSGVRPPAMIGLEGNNFVASTYPNEFGYARFSVSYGTVSTTLLVVVDQINDAPESTTENTTVAKSFQVTQGNLGNNRFSIDLWNEFTDQEDLHYLNFEVTQVETPAFFDSQPTVFGSNGLLVFGIAQNFSTSGKVHVQATDQQGASTTKIFEITKSVATRHWNNPNGISTTNLSANLALDYPEAVVVNDAKTALHLQMGGGTTVATHATGEDASEIYQEWEVVENFAKERGIKNAIVEGDWTSLATASPTLHDNYGNVLPFAAKVKFEAPDSVELWWAPRFATNSEAIGSLRKINLGQDYYLDAFHFFNLEAGQLNHFGNIDFRIEGLESKQDLQNISVTVELTPILQNGKTTPKQNISATDSVYVDDFSVEFFHTDPSEQGLPKNVANLVVNSIDSDGDAIPDYHDGFDYDSHTKPEHERTDLDNEISNIDDDILPDAVSFKPLSITIPRGIDLNQEELLCFIFADEEQYLQPDSTEFTRSHGATIRIWTKSSGEVRNYNFAEVAGDRVRSSNEIPFWYSFAELDGNAQTRTITLFVEALGSGDSSISVNLTGFKAKMLYTNNFQTVSISSPDKYTTEEHQDNAVFKIDGNPKFSSGTSWWKSYLGFMEEHWSSDSFYRNWYGLDQSISWDYGHWNYFGNAVYFKVKIKPELSTGYPDLSIAVASDPFSDEANSDYQFKQHSFSTPNFFHTDSAESGSGQIDANQNVYGFYTSTIDPYTYIGTTGINSEITITAKDDSIVEWDEAVVVELITADEFNLLVQKSGPISTNASLNVSPRTAGFSNLSPIPGRSEFNWWSLLWTNDNYILSNDPNKRKASVTILDNDKADVAQSHNVDFESTGVIPSATAYDNVTIHHQDGDVIVTVPVEFKLPHYNANDNLRPIFIVETKLPFRGYQETTLPAGAAKMKNFPNQIKAKATLGGFTSDLYSQFDVSHIKSILESHPHATIRFAVLAPKELEDHLPTGIYDFDIEFSVRYEATFEAGGSVTLSRTIQGMTPFINRVNPAFGGAELGKRWTLAELDRIFFVDGTTMGGAGTLGSPVSDPSALNDTKSSSVSRLAREGAYVQDGVAIVRGDNSVGFYEDDAKAFEGRIVRNVNALDTNHVTYSSLADWQLKGTYAETSNIQGVDYENAERWIEWTFTELSPDKIYQLFADWNVRPDATTSVAYHISNAQRSGGGSGPYTIYIDQRFQPGQSSFDESATSEISNNLRSLGFYTPDSSGTIKVRLSNKSGSYIAKGGYMSAKNVMVVERQWEFTKPDGSFAELKLDMSTFGNEFFDVVINPDPPNEPGDPDGPIIETGPIAIQPGSLDQPISETQTRFYLDYRNTGSRYIFDHKGLLVEALDQYNNQTEYEYIDGDGDNAIDDLHLIRNQGVIREQSSSVKYTYKFDYSTHGYLSKITDFAGRETIIKTNQYNPFTGQTTYGNIIEIELPDTNSGFSLDQEYRFEYIVADNFVRMQRVIDGRNNDSEIDYEDQYGVFTTVENADGGQWSVHSEFGRPFTVSYVGVLNTDILLGAPHNGRPDETYLPNGQLEQAFAILFDARASEWSYQTDRFGLTVTAVNPYGTKWDDLRDKHGLVYRHRDPSQKLVMLDNYGNVLFDSLGLPNYETIKSVFTEFDYNEIGQLLNVNRAYNLANQSSSESWSYIDVSIETGNEEDERSISKTSQFLNALGQATSYEYSQSNSDPQDSNSPIVYSELVKEHGLLGEAIRSTLYESVASGTHLITNLKAGLTRKSVVAYGSPDAVTTMYEYFGEQENDDQLLFGLVKSVTQAFATPVAQITSYEYDDRRNNIKVTESGVSTYFTFDDMNQLVGVMYPKNQKAILGANGIEVQDDGEFPLVTYKYDQAGNRIESKDQKGNVTKYDYDERNQLQFKRLPKSGVPNELNQGDFVTLDSNALGLVTEYIYDNNGNLIEEVLHLDSADRITNYVYDSRNLLIEKTTASSGLSASIAVAAGVDNRTSLNIDQSILAQANTTPTIWYSYDASGNLIEISDPRYPGQDANTWYFYDALGNLRAIQSPVDYDAGHNNPVEIFDVDKLGRVVSSYFRYGTGFESPFAVTTYEYDGLGRLQMVKTPADSNGNSAITTNQYDLRDNLIQQVVFSWNEQPLFDNEGNPQNGSFQEQLTAYDYDALDQVIRVDHPNPGSDLNSGLVTVYAYDQQGNLVRELIRPGSVAQGDFAGSDGIPYTTISHLDNLAYPSLINSDTMVRYSKTYFDSLGRVIASVAPDPDGAGVMESAVTINDYDISGNQISTKVLFKERPGDPDDISLKTETEFDNLNRPWKISGPGEVDGERPQTRIAYNLDGSKKEVITKQVLSEAIAGSFDLNEMVKWQKTEFKYDRAGREIQQRFFTSVEYEELYPEQAPAFELSTEKFYDAADNLIYVRTVDGKESTYTYDILNRRIESIEILDPNSIIGNQGTELSAISRFQYSADNQRVAVIQSDGKESRYTYDAFGNVVTISDDSGVVQNKYDGSGNRVLITNPANIRTKYNYDFTGRLLSVEDLDISESATYYQYDNFSNLVSKVDKTGKTVTYVYDNTGNLLRESWPSEYYVAEFKYTPLGDLLWSKNSSDDVTISEYEFFRNSSNQINEAKYNLGDSTFDTSVHLESHYEYDLSGALRKTSKTHSGKTIETRFVRDGLGRETRASQVIADNGTPKRIDAYVETDGFKGSFVTSSTRYLQSEYVVQTLGGQHGQVAYENTSWGSTLKQYFKDGSLSQLHLSSIYWGYLHYDEHGRLANYEESKYDSGSGNMSHSGVQTLPDDFYDRPEATETDVENLGMNFKAPNAWLMRYDDEGRVTVERTGNWDTNVSVIVQNGQTAFQFPDLEGAGNRFLFLRPENIDPYSPDGGGISSAADWKLKVIGPQGTLYQAELHWDAYAGGFVSEQPITGDDNDWVDIFNNQSATFVVTDSEYISSNFSGKFDIFDSRERRQYDWNHNGTLRTVEVVADKDSDTTVVDFEYDPFGNLVKRTSRHTENGEPGPIQTAWMIYDNGEQLTFSSTSGQSYVSIDAIEFRDSKGKLLAVRKFDSQMNSFWLFYDIHGKPVYARSTVVDVTKNVDFGVNGIPVLDPAIAEVGEFSSLFHGYQFDINSGLYFKNGRVFEANAQLYLSQSATSIMNGATNAYQRDAVAPSGTVQIPSVGYNYYSSNNVTMWSELVGEPGVVQYAIYGGLAILGTAAVIGTFGAGAGLLLIAAGATAGIVNGVAETYAANKNATLGEYGANAGIGALFGAATPVGTFYSVGGGLVGGASEAAVGGDFFGRGYLGGSLVAGIVGGGLNAYARVARSASRTFASKLAYAARGPAVELGAASTGFAATYASTGDFDKSLMVANFSALGAGAIASRGRWFKCFVGGTPMWVPEQTYSKLAHHSQINTVDTVKDVSNVNCELPLRTLSGSQHTLLRYALISLAIVAGATTVIGRSTRKKHLPGNAICNPATAT